MKAPFNRLVARFRSFWVDSDGSTIPMVAAGLMVSMAAASLGVDYVMARTHQQSLELSADAAALAAAARLPNVIEARAAAAAYVEKNMPSAEYGMVLDPADVEIGTWDPATREFTPSRNQRSGSDSNAVRVATRLSEENGNPMGTIFSSVIGVDNIEVSASAIAGRGGTPCLLTLNPDRTASARIKAKARVETTGCGVQVNSTAGRALQMDGQAVLESTDVCVGGTAYLAGSSSLDPDPREHCPGRADPLAGMEPPYYGVCDWHNAVYEDEDEIELSPGVYCGGLEITDESEITLEPGLYVIKDGPLIVAEESSISGKGVTIFLTGNGASLQFDDSSMIEMSAPTDGDMKGILIYQDRDFENDHEWDGDSTTNLTGVIYLPTGELSADSGNHITPYNSCTVLIVKDLEVINMSTLSIDLSAGACRKSLPTAYGRGVVLLQ